MSPDIKKISAQPTLGIRAQVRMEEIGEQVGKLMPEVMKVAGKNAVGPILARYHEWDGQGGEIEIATCVKKALPGEGRVQAGELPAGRAVVCVHEGPYDGLNQTWQELSQWLKEHDLKCAGSPWEAYLSDCAVTPPEKLQTEIVWPIEG